MPLHDSRDCVPFEGAAGIILGGAISLTALVIYVYIYLRNRHTTDPRTGKVFAMDMAKIFLSQCVAWYVNLLWTVENSFLGGFQSIDWYLPTFFTDMLLGVPLGVLMGRFFNRFCQRMVDSGNAGAKHWAFVRMNCVYGKYSETHENVFSDRHPKLRWSWWWAQLLSWSVIVGISRFLVGFFVPFLRESMGKYSPYYALALLVHQWDVSCTIKQCMIAGLIRTLADVAQVGFIDLFNRLRRNISREGFVTLDTPTTPSLSPLEQ